MKRPVVIVQLAKPYAEMSEEERAQLAAYIARQVAATPPGHGGNR